MQVHGLGTVEARIIADIGFEIGAALTGLDADSGDAVEAGQVLAQLHFAGQEARISRVGAGVAAAKATLGKAEANVSRAQAVLAKHRATNARQIELAGRNAVSTQATEESQRDVNVAAADLAVAHSEVVAAGLMLTGAEAALR